jgi:hypothetical protein
VSERWLFLGENVWIESIGYQSSVFDWLKKLYKNKSKKVNKFPHNPLFDKEILYSLSRDVKYLSDTSW